MHVLETIKNKDTMVSASEVCEEIASSLLARMWDVKQLSAEPMANIIESWRTEIMMLRNAIRRFEDDESKSR